VIVECPSRVAGMRNTERRPPGRAAGAGGRGPTSTAADTRSSAFKTNKEVRSTGVHARPLFWIHSYG
jgi:hypothetical protein